MNNVVEGKAKTYGSKASTGAQSEFGCRTQTLVVVEE
jgi:hypothetical protein